MFGLMRPQQCCHRANEDAEYLYHRRHYCGTCKVIGQKIAHSNRLMLNFDTVFLAELLSQLHSEQLCDWDATLLSINTCFSIPKGVVPFSLHYAAVASVLLGELKIDDQNKDENRLKWKLTKYFYSKSFQKATTTLKEWGIDTTSIYSWIDIQNQREQTTCHHSNLETTLNYYAEATAQITGQIFKGGTQQLPNAVDLYELGYSFGKLMYILDAFEDYEQDIKNNQFNPLSSYWNHSLHPSTTQLDTVRQIILTLEQNIHKNLQALPLDSTKIEQYQNRLSSNLATRLYQERYQAIKLSERIQARWVFAKNYANQWICTRTSWLQQLNYYVLVLAIFVNPQTSTYLPQEGKLEIAGWGLLFTSILAGIGITGVIRKNRKERRKQKRQKRYFKRLVRKLKNIFLKKHSCWSECCSSCCSSCCDSCCSDCCEGCCDAICESESPLFWLLVIGAIILTTALIVLILFLAGVL